MTHPESPALRKLSSDYPARFGGRIPSRIKMLMDVRPEWPFTMLNPELADQVARSGESFDCWVNSHGAVAVVFPDGYQLGVRPHEFIVEEYA